MQLANKTCVVTGGNRGIGLEVRRSAAGARRSPLAARRPLAHFPPLPLSLPQLVRQLLAKNNTVIATARKPEAANDLQKLQASAGGRLSVTKLDVTQPGAVESWAAEVKALAPHVDVSLPGMQFMPA